MRSDLRVLRGLVAATLLAGSLVMFQACGRKGPGIDMTAALNKIAGKGGCLNELGTRFSRYLQGEIGETEWSATFDCATSSLEMFRSYVRGSIPGGYTREDMRAFVQNFMVTERGAVSDDLIRSAFELKASLLGGNSEILSYAEFSVLTEYLRLMQRESITLLPHLSNRLKAPTPANLITLADQIERSANRLADGIRTEHNPDFTQASAQTLVNELARLFDWPLRPDAALWLGAGKSLFISGRSDAMEGALWPRALRMLGALGGPALASWSVRGQLLKPGSAYSSLVRTLTRRVRHSLQQTLTWNNGSLPLGKVDLLVDTLPSEWVRPGKTSLKNTIRPLTQKILQSKIPDAIDAGSVESLLSAFDEWLDRQEYLEAIYTSIPDHESGVSAQDFTDAAERLLESLDEKGKRDVRALIHLANAYVPLFLGDDAQITFTRWRKLTLHHLNQMNWMRLTAERLIRPYASLLDGDKVTFEAFRRFVLDYREFGLALGAIDPRVPDFEVRRFREANLFTYASDGDAYLDLDEATYYIATLYSAHTLASRITEAVRLDCRSLGSDGMGGDLFDAFCFRRSYISRAPTLWDHFPFLVEEFRTMSDARKANLIYAMEKAARIFGYTDEPMSSSEITGFAGVAHYVETLFQRFDADTSQVMDKNEALVAVPIFTPFLAEVGGLDPTDTGMMNAVFTYTVKYGHPPSKDVKGIAHFLLWRARKPFWKLTSRRYEVFKAIGALNDPKAPLELPNSSLLTDGEPDDATSVEALGI